MQEKRTAKDSKGATKDFAFLSRQFLFERQGSVRGYIAEAVKAMPATASVCLVLTAFQMKINDLKTGLFS